MTDLMHTIKELCVLANDQDEWYTVHIYVDLDNNNEIFYTYHEDNLEENQIVVRDITSKGYLNKYRNPVTSKPDPAYVGQFKDDIQVLEAEYIQDAKDDYDACAELEDLVEEATLLGFDVWNQQDDVPTPETKFGQSKGALTYIPGPDWKP